MNNLSKNKTFDNTNKYSNNNTKSTSNKIQVCIRIRPLLDYEDLNFWEINSDSTQIYTSNYFSTQSSFLSNNFIQNPFSNFSEIQKNYRKAVMNTIYPPQIFNFDKIYSENHDTQIIYKEKCKNIISHILQGYNGSIFMYGQTTSGKTFSMLGSPNNPGILPCALRDIFNNIKKFSNDIKINVYCSYIEIYNENIHDLLSNSNFLKLVDDKKYGTIVEGAKKLKIDNFETAIGIKDFGEENRKYRETLINEYSSRSHTIFQIFIEKIENFKILYGCLNLIDLAGSERINEYDNSKNNIKNGETGYINKSLFVLANVINKLAENKKSYIPYRDSKLTRLLSQALGGNSLTTIICTISPASMNFYQTLSTLRFATRAKNVKLKMEINEYVNDNEKIEFYKNEIKKLKEKLNEYDNENNLNEIKNAYESVNNELENYKKLYFIEKQKNDDIQKKVEQMIYNKNFNLNNNVDNNINNNYLILLKESNKKGNNNIKEKINTQTNNNKRKIESPKLLRNYKNELSSLQNIDTEKLMSLQNDLHINNKNINRKHNNSQKKLNPNIIFRNKLESSKYNSCLNLMNLKNNKDENNIIDNDEVIIKINDGKIFDDVMFNLDKNNFIHNQNSLGNNIQKLKDVYEIKNNFLDKAMDDYRKYIEKYYRNKIKEINKINTVETIKITDELPILTITKNHSKILNKLRGLHDNKKKEIENIFFTILKEITLMNNYNNTFSDK